MTWLTLQTRMAVRCPTCEKLVPLLGLRERAVCVSCTTPLDVRAMHEDASEYGMRHYFGGYHDVIAESLLYADGHELRDGQRGYSVQMEVVRKAPACGCGAVLPIPEPGASDIVCASCSDITPVRWPDEATRRRDPRISCVLGDAGEAGGRGAPIKPQSMSGSLVTCGSCGAPGAAEGRRRTLACRQCSARTFLSDAVLTTMFTHSTDHLFYLAYELDEAAELAMYEYLARHEHVTFKKPVEEVLQQRVAAARERDRRRVLAATGPLDLKTARKLATSELSEADAAHLDSRLDDAQRAAFATDRVSPMLLAEWARASSPATRASAARAAAAESPLVPVLARDPSPPVRAAIAARKSTAPELLAELRKDPDPTVSAAAKANPSFQPGFFTRLFGG